MPLQAAMIRNINESLRFGHALIPGRGNGPREARPDGANPESSNYIWIPGPREDACPGMTLRVNSN
jgi:hypothetical protein